MAAVSPEYAEQIAVQCRNGNGGTLWYLATMRIWDDEGRKRVERHRRMRAAKGFETIERYTGLETLELEERSRRVQFGWFGR